ncbi:Disintegrin and metalloproteinase domain-containing protein 12 [Larimichthys crocea]|uniref:Uncharacterized protein n=1 Tax=Larimichthys crocea TaxID=215358 RepID=A0ACD3RRG5_LARCR|nr:Disintegrin and metalloproteinase domain-containing protein 12 [Larimichthys crocea]
MATPATTWTATVITGICQTHEQQCITLWGQGAKPAPGICFQRVNSAGDPYGNCGKDSKGSFAKCEVRDAKCGKIQCQGGANRPVIGTNAVSIETNIPLQDGGRILCRGTHVYLGDDMPDPGLVLTGTKCGDGMMCLNRQCQNVSVFGVHECSAKCSGRGVCNNNKNCHCEAHWAPPFCDKAGLGGSVDSGPIRLADSRNLTVGILVALLTVLGAGLIICIKRKTLLGLLFTSKKNPIEKLRSVSAAISRPSAPNQPPSVSTASPSRPAPPLPHNATIFKPPHWGPEAALPPAPYPSHSLRRLPQCPPVHLSHPVPLSLTLSLSPGPVQPRPPVPPPHIHVAPRVASFRSASRHNSCRMVMELEKPSPPQKPLPADPRSSRPVRSPSRVQGHKVVQGPSAVCGPAPVHCVPRPVRPVPHPKRCSVQVREYCIYCRLKTGSFFGYFRHGPVHGVVGRALVSRYIWINRNICVMSDVNNSEEPDKDPESEECPAEDSFGFGDDLELNQFDGLPFSSRYYKLLKERKTLPVWKVRCEFEDALVNNQLLIVSGTAKTGRSTQIPQWCAEFCLSAQYQHGMVVCTQTNRQQAVDLALRVADEMDVNIGHEVGYTIPLETCCSSETVLRYCTDDMLLREMMSDPFLEHYGVIIIDQAHERTVSTGHITGPPQGHPATEA